MTIVEFRKHLKKQGWQKIETRGRNRSQAVVKNAFEYVLAEYCGLVRVIGRYNCGTLENLQIAGKDLTVEVEMPDVLSVDWARKQVGVVGFVGQTSLF